MSYVYFEVLFDCLRFLMLKVDGLIMIHVFHKSVVFFSFSSWYLWACNDMKVSYN